MDTVAFTHPMVHVGADPAALDPSSLSPFHVAILSGNTPVVRHFISLYRNIKSTDPKYQSFCDGCHPSKATASKGENTPLQLAIKRENIDVIELLLRDATVHDVEKCWGLLDQGLHVEIVRRKIVEVLLTKVRFAPSVLGSSY